MRALLDVSVLIALLDGNHGSHSTVQRWMAAYGEAGWASCPITQNGCIRIMSNPRYARPRPLQETVARLREAARQPIHEFWPDDISLLSEAHMTSARIHGPAQLTDAYLLALAVAHDGRFVTLDRGVVRTVVPGATEDHLVVI